MPVRSLRSSVLRWPDRDRVDLAVRVWARDLAGRRKEILRIGYFGSYARGDWGVGSDVDVLIVVRASDEPFHRRSAAYDATALPVPADVLVYTAKEWEAASRRPGLPGTARRDAVWVFEAEAGS